MPYVGYGVENSTVDLAEQTITASGNVTETLSRSVNEDTEILVFVNNALKDTESYSIGGTLKNELTFTIAPTAGEAIVVRYLSKSVDIVAVAPSGVNTWQGRTGAVNLTTNDLNDLVDANAIKENSVSVSELASSGTDNSLRAVTNNHIKDNAVTSSKVASDANVDGNRAIGTNHIKDNAITDAKIPNDGVSSKKLALRYADEIAANGAGLGEGDIYYDEALNELRMHNGTTWQDVSIGGTTTDVGDLPLNTTYTGIRYAPDITTTENLTVNPSTDYAYTFCENLTVDTGHVLDITTGKNLKVGVFSNLGGFTGGTIGGGGSSTSLPELTDVNVSGPSVKQVLRYNGTTWTNTQLTYSDLSGQPFTQVQSDWTQTNTSHLGYINNKPSIVTPNSSPTFTNVTVSGDLNVIGTTTQNNVTNLNVNNNELVLNDNVGEFEGNATNGSDVVSGMASTTGIQVGATVSIVSDAAGLTLSGSATVASVGATSITLNVNFGGAGSATGIKLAIPVAPTLNASMVVERSASNDVRVRWNETDDRWEFTNDGTTYNKIPVPSEYGDYNNLQNLPNLAAQQQQVDWDSTTGVTSIANKPSIPSYIGQMSNVSTAAGIDASPTITTGHVLKWNGTAWSPAAETGGGGSGTTGLQTREDKAKASVSLDNDATDSNVNVDGYKSYVLLAITTDADAWVRVYSTAAARTQDLNRSEGTDPSPGSGVIAEVRVDGTQMITPGTVGFNFETSPLNTIYLSVTNRSGSTQIITTTLKAIQLEA
tara:strand:+ start:11589 stop:13889 length:2301 start_codon:yes stop_codon:yes gene_type:complete